MRVPMLMYHWFDGPDALPTAGPEFQIRPDDFRQQMQWIADQGLSTLTVGELSKAMRGEQQLPARPLVITFDDAYEDFYEQAFEIINQLDLKVTLYVITGLVGKSNVWDQKRGEPVRNILSWERLRELASAGVEIGAHSVSHPDMRTLSDSELDDECQRCRKTLEDGLGQPVQSFAYPFGFYDSRVRKAVTEAGYEAACSVLLRPTDMLRSRRMSLMRAIVHANKSFDDFKRRVRWAAPWHLG